MTVDGFSGELWSPRDLIDRKGRTVSVSKL